MAEPNPIVRAWDDRGAPHPFATFLSGYQAAEKHMAAGAPPVAFAKDGALFWHGEFKRGVSCELYAGPVAQEPVAWLIDWPDEPDLGHYIAESPADIDSGRSRALVFADAAPVAAQAQPAVNQSLTTDQPSDADIIGIAVAQSLVCHDHGDIVSAWREDADIRAHVLAFARALLARYRAQAVPAQQPVSGADGLPALVEYLRQEADFNRSWTDGRRGSADGQSPEYITRRQVLATRADVWADTVAAMMAAHRYAAQPQPSGNAGELPDERAAFEWWASDEGEHPRAIERNGNGNYKLAQTASAWAVWQARAALATQASGQTEQDPLQPAVDWLYRAVDSLLVVDIQSRLLLGPNRAGRLLDAARAAAKGEA